MILMADPTKGGPLNPERENTNTKGDAMRFSKGKLPFRLVPWDAFVEVVKVYRMGCGKYAPRNWENGLSFDETFDSLQRHAVAWYLGEDYDEESGLHHMAHVAWNALALVAFTFRGRTELDDRPLRVTQERYKVK